jgi:hypothetical protein
MNGRLMFGFVPKSFLAPGRVQKVDKKKNREGVIRAAWEERGRKLWTPEAHGKGQPLNIPAEQAGTSAATILPLTPRDNLEFQFYCARHTSQPFNYIACEGIVVETWGEHEPPGFVIAPIDD